MGDGIYKSTDAGATWKNMGLAETGRIGRIIVHPTNPNIVYVCALGRATGPQQERGVYQARPTAARTWERVLFVEPEHRLLRHLDGREGSERPDRRHVAGRSCTRGRCSAAAPGSGVYMTRDGGATWKKAETGLPKSPVGKIDVAVAPSDSKRMYALIQTANQGSLWRSDDAGATWRVVSWDRTLIGRAGYYIRIKVNPANADEVLVANSSFHRSIDGGQTFPIERRRLRRLPRHLDGSEEPDHWVATGDGGMGITTDHGADVQQHRAADRPDVPRRHRQPGAVLDLQQPAGRRHDARAEQLAGAGAERAVVSAGAGRRWARRTRRTWRWRRWRGAPEPRPWEPGIGGCESGFTLPDLAQSRHHLGELLRQRGDALRRAHRAARGRSARGSTRSTRSRPR